MTSINSLNPFNQAAAVQAQGNIFATQKVGKSFAQATGENQETNNASVSSSNLTGVNTNIGVGSTSYIAAQAGKSAGVGKTYAFA